MITGLQDIGQVVTADDVSKDQHSANHGEAACASYSQRHSGTLPSLGQMFPIADQQKGRK